MFRDMSRGLWSHRCNTKFEADHASILQAKLCLHVTVVQLIAGRLFVCFIKIVLKHDPLRNLVRIPEPVSHVWTFGS